MHPGWIFDIQWIKAKASAYDGNCIEVARVRRGYRDMILIRNSRDINGPTLEFTQAEFAAFQDGVRNREFDD